MFVNKRFLYCFAVFLITLCSCGGNSTGASGVEGDLLISVPKREISAKAGQQFVTVKAFASWTISVDTSDGEKWARVDKTSGSASASDIVLSWDAIPSGEQERTCVLTLTCAGKTSSATVTQKSSGSSVEPDEPSEPGKAGGWMELPALDNASDMLFVTRDMTLSNKQKIRNYSMYFDCHSRIAYWVAYPLNSELIGSGSRTNEWGYDPKVPSKYQAVLFSGFKGGYDRGHQLPSADRLKRGVNETTFYFTNMTPQRGELNQNAWATLEGKVRDWASSFDTLYVVTGADYRDSKAIAKDNVGNSVCVPDGYFKALLGYKKSGTIGNSTGGYLGIAFYFEHRRYDDSAIMKSQAMTIDALEKKLGIDFFVNLPGKVGQGMADKIESTKDSWWR
ncbi:MAG TPA: hypothetical protein DHU72_02845 [Rikenellaceae bacterium]|nr:hypothetical protein [Rikenellaceae bacterium]